MNQVFSFHTRDDSLEFQVRAFCYRTVLCNAIQNMLMQNFQPADKNKLKTYDLVNLFLLFCFVLKLDESRKKSSFEIIIGKKCIIDFRPCLSELLLWLFYKPA